MVSQKKLDIIFLRETHGDGDNEVDWGLWRRGLYTPSNGTNLSAGVATLFCSGLHVKVTSTTDIIAGRTLAVRAEVSLFVKQCGQHECEGIGGFCTTDFTLDRSAAVLSGLGAVDVWRVKHPHISHIYLVGFADHHLETFDLHIPQTQLCSSY